MTERPAPRTWTIRRPGGSLLAIVRWLKTAIADDSRVALACVGRHGDALVACDGIRLHSIEAPPEWPDAALVRLDYVPPTVNGPLLLVEEPVGPSVKYPNFDAVLPSGEPEAEIYVNARVLMEALQGFCSVTGRWDHPAYIRFHGKDKPIEIVGLSGGPYVLIMPLHRDERGGKFWRPKFEARAEAPTVVPPSHDEPQP
jgi:hypothetical protein